MSVYICVTNNESRILLKGDRTKKVGVVDSEYIVHRGIPTLGGSFAYKVTSFTDIHVVWFLWMSDFLEYEHLQTDLFFN